MTLQQLKYIIAIERYRSFAKAAEACNISQPTLSGMLQKLEEELGIRIFDRSNKSVSPTKAGEEIIAQARCTIAQAERIPQMVQEARGGVSGPLNLSVGPTIAPYILPQFISLYTETYPLVELSIREMKAEAMLEALQRGELDAGMALSNNARAGILEIPLYTEPFWVYLSDKCWRRLPVFRPENLENEQMWIMKEAQCLRESAFSFCRARAKGRHIYEAGSIETLIRVVDLCGGYTIIPEMHLPLLNEEQKQRVRRIEGEHHSCRRVSLYIREDYIREKMLQTITTTLLHFVPRNMMEPRIAKFGIRL